MLRASWNVRSKKWVNPAAPRLNRSSDRSCPQISLIEREHDEVEIRGQMRTLSLLQYDFSHSADIHPSSRYSKPSTSHASPWDKKEFAPRRRLGLRVRRTLRPSALAELLTSLCSEALHAPH